MQIERVSIELTERCSKGCGFCYNGSARDGDTAWTLQALRAFALDCAAHGVAALSFGGGEPLEAPDLLWPMLDVLRGRAFRSMTTNGLSLDAATIARLAGVAIDKVHISIHNPRDRDEVARVIAQTCELAAAGVRSGVNLLVRRSQLDAARVVAGALAAAGIDNRRVMYLPMRGSDTPSPRELAGVTHGAFQSVTCLSACGESPRFASVSARLTVARCSYTLARRPLAEPTYDALVAALDGLALLDCSHGQLVKLGHYRAAT